MTVEDAIPVFRVGDVVERLVPGNFANKVTQGQRYKVLEVSGANISLIDDLGCKDGFDADKFKRVNPFRPGDVVRRTTMSHTLPVTVGQTYVVEKCGRTGNHFTITHPDDNGKPIAFDADKYELVEGCENLLRALADKMPTWGTWA